MKSLLFVCIFSTVFCKKAPQGEKPEWAKKDIRDFSDADLERLLDQWEEDEEPIPPDELPEGHPERPTPQLDLSKLDTNDPQEMLKASKKGKTVMMFVRVNDFVSPEDTETITSIWQTGLYNNHIQAERFNMENDRVLFMFRDGSAAWDAKDFLIEQERCEDVQLEQKTFLGKFCKLCQKEEDKIKPKKEKQKKEKKKNKKNKTEKTEL